MKLVITLRGERRRSDILHFLLSATCIVGMHYCIGARVEHTIGMTLGFLWTLGILLRQQYGTSTLTIDSGYVALDRRTLGIGRTRKFRRDDTERLGFEQEFKQSREDAALALMVRTVMMPMRFSHGITSLEAEAVFAKIKESGSWIGSLIRPVGTPIF